MAMKRHDLAGRRFGRWTVIKHIKTDTHSRWLCRCDCGTERIKKGSVFLQHEPSRSCGCRAITHHRSNTSEYHVWEAMKARCLNKSHFKWGSYGGRGIKISKRWMSFNNFFTDMGERPSKNHQLDRINNNGPYAPSNCRWATRKTQQNNTRRNRFITANGLTLSTRQWSKKTGLGYETILQRINKYGWTEQQAVTLRRWPSRKDRNI